MSANLYDILDVEESASAEEIRAAWKSAVADLDPTDRRFRAYSDAAGVLLDDDKRAAYDAELAAEREAAAPAPATAAATAATTPAGTPGSKPGKAAAADPAAGAAQDEPARTPSEGPPGWVLTTVGVAAAAALVLAVVLLLLPGGTLFSDSSPKKIAQANATFEKSSISAEGAAERLVTPVFSYNYETMDADLERVQQYLGPELAAKQAKLWPTLTKDAVAQQVVVEAKAEAAALTRLSKDGKNATVLVFLVQDSTKRGTQQTPLKMWVSLDLVRKAGSADDWLVSGLCVDAGCKS
ncbi:J domain-containing protein [Nocardioides sp. LML1-1-1.1]|uniref:J domain-containing protein n=1 Tax=Nocardioides sp. LML1-1-1.1 TaxID=3135248 RepID=UPI003422E19C